MTKQKAPKPKPPPKSQMQQAGERATVDQSYAGWWAKAFGKRGKR